MELPDKVQGAVDNMRGRIDKIRNSATVTGSEGKVNVSLQFEDQQELAADWIIGAGDAKILLDYLAERRVPGFE